VRFEMPFAIWCTTCPKPTIIGQGVRFNAEKKKVGNYYTTPIFSFRMKHVSCGGWIEIRTDPQNTAYVVAEGAKKRDTGEDKVLDGDLEIRTDEEKKRLQEDAFAALEVKIGDRVQAQTDKTRIEELFEAKDRDWDDPYGVNKRLRRSFRVERHALEKKAAATEQIKDRMSLGFDLLEETDEDRRRAAMIEFGEDNRNDSSQPFGSTAHNQALFPQSGKSDKISGKSKKADSATMAKKQLQANLNHNSRVSTDPFLIAKTTVVGPSILSKIKRKRKSSSSQHGITTPEPGRAYSPEPMKTTTIVDYESS